MADKKNKTILEQKSSYNFRTDTLDFITTKGKDGPKHYVTGYISTDDVDLYNDIVSQKAMKSMLAQIKSSKILLDYDHEAWRDSPNIIPVGKIVDAKIDSKGLWVKAELNAYSPKFKSLWGSIKGGFVNAFSIAFKPLKTVMKNIGDKEVRIIDDLMLLNVAMTGNPVNQHAAISDYGMKSVMLKALNDIKQIEGESAEECVLIPKSRLKSLEENQMTEEPKIEDMPVETPVEETKESPVEEPKEAPKEEEKPEEKPEAEPAPVEEKSNDAMEKMAEELKSMKEKQDATEAELKSLKEKMVFKSVAPEAPKTEEETPDVQVLNAI